MKLSLIAATAFIFSTHAVSASNVGLEKVLGKLILNSAGSSLGSAYLSVGVETKGRNIIELHFVSIEIPWSSPNATAFNHDRKIESADSVMVHCRKQRYSPYPNEDGTQTAWNDCLAGSKYAWGEYSAGDFIYNVRQEEKDKMTTLFKNACSYTDI